MGSLRNWKRWQKQILPSAAIGGYGYVRTELANKVLTGTYYSLGIALVIIFILVSLIFRSAMAGLLGIIPLSISVLILFRTDGPDRCPAGYRYRTSFIRNDRGGG